MQFTQEAKQTLYNYEWTGNVRELENIVERAVNLVEGDMIGSDLLGIVSASAGKHAAKHRHGWRLAELEKLDIRFVERKSTLSEDEPSYWGD